MRKPAKNRNSREHFISAFPDRPIVCESRASSIHGAEAGALLKIFRVLAKRGRAVPVVYGCRNSQSSQQLFKSFHFQTTRVIFSEGAPKLHGSHRGRLLPPLLKRLLAFSKNGFSSSDLGYRFNPLPIWMISCRVCSSAASRRAGVPPRRPWPYRLPDTAASSLLRDAAFQATPVERRGRTRSRQRAKTRGFVTHIFGPVRKLWLAA